MDKFKIVSEYKTTGDQPEAVEKLSRGILNGQKKLLFKVIHKHYFLLVTLYCGVKVLLQIVQEL